MTTHKTVGFWSGVSRLYLMIFSTVITSCTYDYFEDETNFRLYVPQIENGEIENFHVAFHDESGRHVLTREISAPFDKDDLMKQGILRFKLPYGRNYRITCFADYAIEASTPGEQHTDSYLKKTPAYGAEDVYSSRTTNPRSYLSTATVYPPGFPEAVIERVVNIDKNQCYKGQVIINLKELPAFVSLIDIYYKGLATKYNFDGTFDRFSPNDRILASINTADYTFNGVVSYSNIINPSVGVTPFGLMDALAARSIGAYLMPCGEPLELEMRLYSAVGDDIGVISFTDEDFQRLKTTDPSKIPTAGDNVTKLDNLVLEPQKTIVITFSGFTLFHIGISGWGDIVGGGTTPF